MVVPKQTQPGEPPQRRLYVDYCTLNNFLPPVVKAHSKAKRLLTLVPFPKIDDIYANLVSSHNYSTLDLRSGYYCIALSVDSKRKSAFVTAMGKFEFQKVPFGLAQVPAYFQWLINEVLSSLDFPCRYLDDILIYSPDPETHLKHIKIVFQHLLETRLVLKEIKCNFLKRHIQYLGHLISETGIEPLPEKLSSLQDMLPPGNLKEVKQFWSSASYYRKFVPRFADIS